MLAILRFVVLGLAIIGAGARAEEVKIPLAGLALNGELTIAKGKTLNDGVVLLVHGTLMHGRMELIAGLQKRLAQQGINSLAITLALGLDDRRGGYDCAMPHRHRHEDAVGEIAAWIEWLKSRGARNIAVAGYSRGGAQAALYASTRDDPAITRHVLIAPTLFDAAETAAAYEASFKTPLAPLLANAQALVKDSKGDTMLTGIGLLYCPGTTASASSFASYYADDGKKDTPGLLKAIKKPTLVVVAGNDTVVRDLDKLIAPEPPRVEIAKIDGADHSFLDLYLDDLADKLAEYLSK